MALFEKKPKESSDGVGKIKKKAKKALTSITISILIKILPIAAIVLFLGGIWNWLEETGADVGDALSRMWTEPGRLDTEWWETVSDEDLYKELTAEDSRITPMYYDEIDIDRHSFALLLEEVIDWNNGTYLGDYAERKISIEGDDSYTYFDLDEREEQGWVSCNSYDSGAVAFGLCGGEYEVDTSTRYRMEGWDYVEDPNGDYYSCGMGYIHKYNIYYKRWDKIIIKTNKRVSVTNATKKLEFKISNKWMYLQYPMEWELPYLWSVFYFQDNDRNYISLSSDINDNTKLLTIPEEDLYDRVDAFRPDFKFYKLPSAKNPDEGNLSNVFEALIKYDGEWEDFVEWRDKFKKGEKFEYDKGTSYSNDDILSMYDEKGGNPYGEQLLKGYPQKMIWYSLDHIKQQYDNNGNEVDDPVIHKTVIYYPTSVLEDVQTYSTDYKYDSPILDEISVEKEPLWYDTTGFTEADKYTYPWTWSAIMPDKDFTDNKKLVHTSESAMVEAINRQLTCKNVEPTGYFTLEYFIRNINDYAGTTDKRDVNMLVVGLEEQPQGKNIARAVECAYYYDGYEVNEAMTSYNEGRHEYYYVSWYGDVVDGEGGLRDVDATPDLNKVVREEYGVGKYTLRKDVY